MRQRPIVPYVLGIAGLIPFVGLSALTLMLGYPAGEITAVLLLAYGALILSFLGGTRWGAEIQSRPESPSAIMLSCAMLPPLTGWAALGLEVMASARGPAFGLLITGLAIQMLWDMTAVRNGFFPRWYMPLRILLTSIAIISLSVAALF